MDKVVLMNRSNVQPRLNGLSSIDAAWLRYSGTVIKAAIFAGNYFTDAKVKHGEKTEKLILKVTTLSDARASLQNGSWLKA